MVRHYKMPFAAVGFATVVSLLPGVFLFRMASGLVQLATNSNVSLALLTSTISDATISIMVILALTGGLIVPKLFIDRISNYLLENKLKG